MNDSKRLERLVRAGQMSADDAVSAKHGIDALAEHSLRPSDRQRVPPGSKWALLRWKYLRHQLPEADLRSQVKRLGVWMGVGFAIGMAALGVVWNWIKGPSLPEAVRAHASDLPVDGLSGIAFGFVMYRMWLRPRMERMIELGTALAEPLESMPAFDASQCPTCGAHNARPTVRGFGKWHWILNPALAVNEVLFGQRVVRDAQACQECGADFAYCATCNESIDSGRWRSPRARCGACGTAFPPLRNALGWLITTPVNALAHGIGAIRARGSDAKEDA